MLSFIFVIVCGFFLVKANLCRSIVCLYCQGRIQDFVLGGTKVGEGSGDRLRSPVGPGQSRGKRPRELLGFEYL